MIDTILDEHMMCGFSVSKQFRKPVYGKYVKEGNKWRAVIYDKNGKVLMTTEPQATCMKAYEVIRRVRNSTIEVKYDEEE